MRFVLVLLAACTSEHVYMLDELPAEDWVGLPVEGDGRLLVWLARSDWSNAVGFVRFRCDHCVLGDDVAKLAFFDVPFGHLDLGTVRAALDFGGGKVHLTSTWRSADFELDAIIDGTLAPRAADIALDGCIRFRPTPALLARDPRMHALVSITGAPFDGEHYTIELAGTLGAMRRHGRVCSLAR